MLQFAEHFNSFIHEINVYLELPGVTEEEPYYQDKVRKYLEFQAVHEAYFRHRPRSLSAPTEGGV